MTEFQKIEGRNILFLLAGGFDSGVFERLGICLRERGADILVTSFGGGEIITSGDKFTRVKSVLSFPEAMEERCDAVVVADEVTANAIRNDITAIKFIKRAWNDGCAMVAVGGGAIAFAAAGVIKGKSIATQANLSDELRRAGAKAAAKPIAISGNILSARADADLEEFCADIVEYLSERRAAAA